MSEFYPDSCYGFNFVLPKFVCWSHPPLPEHDLTWKKGLHRGNQVKQVTRATNTRTVSMVCNRQRSITHASRTASVGRNQSYQQPEFGPLASRTVIHISVVEAHTLVLCYSWPGKLRHCFTPLALLIPFILFIFSIVLLICQSVNLSSLAKMNASQRNLVLIADQSSGLVEWLAHRRHSVNSCWVTSRNTHASAESRKGNAINL